MSHILEVWANTGEVVRREFTPEEKEQRAEHAKAEKQREEDFAARAQVHADAIAHAKALGFTDEMIAVMYPGLVEN
jgi:Na+-transporting methylmalonyl-CoA/oxaloacetate decarboxylase gamma subunit